MNVCVCFVYNMYHALIYIHYIYGLYIHFICILYIQYIYIYITLYIYHIYIIRAASLIISKWPCVPSKPLTDKVFKLQHKRDAGM